MIAEGYWKARAVSGGFSKSPEKGVPCVVVELKLLDGPDAGQVINWIGWLSEKTRNRTAESLAHMGFDGENWATVKNKEIIAVVRHEVVETKKGEHKTVARVAFINDPNRSTAKFESIAPDQAMTDSLKALVIDAKQRAGQPADSFEFGANKVDPKDDFKF